MRTLALGCIVAGVSGHATLIQPMSRGYYRKQKGPCGPHNGGGYGCYEPWSAGGTGGYSPCGIIKGEDYTKDTFTLSKLDGAQEVEKHTLHPGSALELKVLFNAHHKGHVVFGICPDSDLAGSAYGNPPTTVDCNDPTLTAAQKESCLADYLSPIDTWPQAIELMDCFQGLGKWAGGKDGAGLMKRSEKHERHDPGPIDPRHPERWYIPPKEFTLNGQTASAWPVGEANFVHTMYFKVPSNLKCKNGKCLLHFFYWTANSCTGDGYIEYFSEKVNGAMHPREECTGGECARIDNRPNGDWTMHGDWWANPQQYPSGSCDARVDDKPTNTWARNVPERFWNCADVYGSDGGSTDLCSGVVCDVQECKDSMCTGGQCVTENKVDGISCSTSCGECATPQCKTGKCECVPRAEGSDCQGGTCKSGACFAQPVNSPTALPQPAGPAPVDCVAEAKCEWTPCSVTCGGGERERSCWHETTQEPLNGGRTCHEVAPLPPFTKESCNDQDCPTPPPPAGTCISPAVAEWGACTPEPQTCDGIPRCCASGLMCCGNMWYAQCKKSCTASETSYAAGKDGGQEGTGMVGVIAAVFGGGLCGGFLVFLAMRKTRAASGEMGSGWGEGSVSVRHSQMMAAKPEEGSTSRVKGTYREQADI